jgi:hypothetical protein
VLGEFGLGSGHVSKEKAANILQTLLDKRFDLLESSIEPAAISRQHVFAKKYWPHNE